MRSTLDLDDELLAAAQRATGAKTKTELIELGLRSLVERAAARRLGALRGAIPEARPPRRRRMPRSGA